MPVSFKVGLSHDFRAADGSISWGDIGLDLLTEAGVTWSFLAPDDGVLTASHVEGYDAVLFASPAIEAATVSGDRPPRVLARFGVGLDTVDLQACTDAGVAVTITPDGARRAVATAALTLILAVLQRLLPKDRMVRENRWDDKLSLLGRGLTGRTVGTFGCGNVALELFQLLQPFATRHVAFDPYRTAGEAAAQGVELVDLDTLLRSSEVLVVTSALTPATLHALDGGRLALMRPDAILVNVARGPIVDTDALARALHDGQLAGAGLDVMDPEPLPFGHPLLGYDNVVLTPHALAWTDEMAVGNGRSALQAILDVRDGRLPRYLANPEVAQHERFRTATVEQNT